MISLNKGNLNLDYTLLISYKISTKKMAYIFLKKLMTLKNSINFHHNYKLEHHCHLMRKFDPKIVNG